MFGSNERIDRLQKVSYTISAFCSIYCYIAVGNVRNSFEIISKEFPHNNFYFKLIFLMEKGFNFLWRIKLHSDFWFAATRCPRNLFIISINEKSFTEMIALNPIKRLFCSFFSTLSFSRAYSRFSFRYFNIHGNIFMKHAITVLFANKSSFLLQIVSDIYMEIP